MKLNWKRERERLNTVRGRGERERLGLFILARNKIDKAFLFIFFMELFTYMGKRERVLCVYVCEKSKSVFGIIEPLCFLFV